MVSFSTHLTNSFRNLIISVSPANHPIGNLTMVNCWHLLSSEFPPFLRHPFVRKIKIYLMKTLLLLNSNFSSFYHQGNDNINILHNFTYWDGMATLNLILNSVTYSPKQCMAMLCCYQLKLIMAILLSLHFAYITMEGFTLSTNRCRLRYKYNLNKIRGSQLQINTNGA